MKTILIVEDDQEYRRILREKLEDAGYKVLTAQSGEEALNIVRSNNLQLILLDMVMPGMDGVSFFYELTVVLQKNIPVVILTNLTETAFPVGVKDFVVKANTSLEQIVEKVKQYAADE